MAHHVSPTGAATLAPSQPSVLGTQACWEGPGGPEGSRFRQGRHATLRGPCVLAGKRCAQDAKGHRSSGVDVWVDSEMARTPRTLWAVLTLASQDSQDGLSPACVGPRAALAKGETGGARCLHEARAVREAPSMECDKMVMQPHAVSGRDWEGGAAVGTSGGLGHGPPVPPLIELRPLKACPRLPRKPVCPGQSQESSRWSCRTGAGVF